MSHLQLHQNHLVICSFVAGSIMVLAGTSVLRHEVVRGGDDLCRKYTCMDLGFAFGTVNRHTCNANLMSCSSSFSEEDRTIAVCCGFCDACHFATCGEHSTCIARAGMDFTCSCNDGFELSASAGCVDRNECNLGRQVNGHNCPSNSFCHNTMGSFECRCPAGYMMNSNNNMCVDKDECADNNSHTCVASNHEVCVNEDPGFRCDCIPEFEMVNGECQPICSLGCANGGHCIAPGQCRCVIGFEGDHCQNDTNECASNSLNNCSHIHADCVNTHGGHFCRCSQGYQHDGKECVDVDECATGLHNCIPSARCTNTFGTFQCFCQGRLCAGECDRDGERMTNGQTQEYGCDRCTCQDGTVTCERSQCDCSSPRVKHGCCPHCARKQCRLNGIVLEIGMETTSPDDPCVVFRCTDRGSIAVIERTSRTCPVLSCDQQYQYVPDGACCPVCKLPPCTSSNNQTIIRLGNGCEEYRCMYYSSADTEWVHSRTVECPPMVNCPNNQIVFMRNKCCPVCESTIFGGLTCTN